jgi:hypothetical protein
VPDDDQDHVDELSELGHVGHGQRRRRVDDHEVGLLAQPRQDRPQAGRALHGPVAARPHREYPKRADTALLAIDAGDLGLGHVSVRARVREASGRPAVQRDRPHRALGRELALDHLVDPRGRRRNLEQLP